jgi:anti-sigma regulatory factor (Ser/Thr protein kinase)
MTAEASGFFAADEAATILKGKAIADEVALQRFYLEAHKKGLACGYPSRLVAQFIAAVGELLGNVIEHSNAAQTGTAWIRCTPREFEFGISDHGVGPRASLLSGPAGLQPKSDTEALTMMLTDGVSRYGIDQGRGRGFRPIFVGLSNLAGYMRFRSGSGSLTVQGTISPDIAATPAQKPHVEGLLLSVLCRAA